MTELVHLAVAAGVATITLDSPANRNALSASCAASCSPTWTRRSPTPPPG